MLQVFYEICFFIHFHELSQLKASFLDFEATNENIHFFKNDHDHIQTLRWDIDLNAIET